MWHKFIKATLCLVGMVTIGSITPTAQASKVVTSMPTVLRGTWHFNMDNENKNTYSFNKHSVKEVTKNGGYTDTTKSKLVKKLGNNEMKDIVVEKQHNGWYGMMWSGTDGILVIKPGNYKLHGKKYHVLYMRDLGWGGRMDKKITTYVAFTHNFSGVHTKSVSTKGMLK
ncbi:hypothetical protein FC61_GL001519 [Levilactobacillus brevis ATCC 14869 = DSM 20054]|uniref:DUF5626 domain-containing protein n=2 Tax=Levilactobacillus brevis TaxID=1580 RepID=U2R5E7_LEVBR|nr:hypothetical protein [Levilactobacillus brevis]ERK45902.1 hypothetical protein HMPREF0495_00168 [Levilactobacillus brevis ATCC 14869 = DSM 20054]KIO99085.1 hypothetical protein QP38_1774 [Levilactobacillus brevis]KRK20730.1 hypothetical protein FC61_GL001519 [Levilactobacillus brevis ATCC 14869 = DSM 20054]